MSGVSGVGKVKPYPVKIEASAAVAKVDVKSIKEFQSYFHSGASITDCAAAYGLLRRSLKDEYQLAFIERFFTDKEPKSSSISGSEESPKSC